jgi:hypothetical protein
MTDKKSKILLYVIGGVICSAAIAYGICYLIIKNNYSKVLTAQQAVDVLDNTVKEAEPIAVEPTDNTDDVSTGSTLGNDDTNLVIDNN